MTWVYCWFKLCVLVAACGLAVSVLSGIAAAQCPPDSKAEAFFGWVDRVSLYVAVGAGALALPALVVECFFWSP